MIRPATKEDLPTIQNIYNNAILNRNKLGDSDQETAIQKKGFLLGVDDPHDLEEYITDSYQFLVAESDGIVTGFLIADHSEEQKFYNDEYKTQFDVDLKKFYYDNPKGMSLVEIAVDTMYAQKGVATELLKYLEAQPKKDSFTYLFSIVTIAPVTNTASLLWHTKQGFTRLAMGRPRKLFELENYAGVLLCKEL